MNSVEIVGIPPWDGRYDFPDDWTFTNRELHRIKQISDIRAGELFDALENNDRAAYVGVAVVVLARHEKHVDPDDFWDAPAGGIRLLLGGADPDVPLTESEPDESSGSSGDGSENDGD